MNSNTIIRTMARKAFCLITLLLVFSTRANIYAADPRQPEYPKVEKLAKKFAEQREFFSTIVSMTVADKLQSIVINDIFPNSGGVSQDRFEQYRVLLNNIDPKVSVASDEGRVVKFFFDGGISTFGNGLEWFVGIEYISGDPKKAGNVVGKIEEIKLEAENTYLIPLDDHWYIFYQHY